MKLDLLGEPDLVISHLKIWVHGRQFPEATDFWDGNWLRVTAYCASQGASVRVDGPIIHLRELVELLRGCQRLYETLSGSAALHCMEPNLRVELRAKTGGHIDVSVMITPDHLQQSHEFESEFDQSYLPAIISACKRILESYPVRQGDSLPDTDGA